MQCTQMKNSYIHVYKYHYYYCMTGIAIWGNITFEINRIGLTEGRDHTDVENCLTLGIAVIDLLYNHCITIGMGNERLHRHGQ